MTNGDKIRAMTDDELSKWLDNVAGCGVCALNERYSGDHCTHECIPYIKKWHKWMQTILLTLAKRLEVLTMNIRCDEWSCANNVGGYCELGDTDFTPLVIEDGECKSYEAKEG